MTCSSLSPKSNPKSVCSLHRSVAGSSSSFSVSSNFPNCYLRSHFSVSQSKALRSRARTYLSELRRATCSEESHLPFCSPFSRAEFLVAASNFFSSTATGPDKAVYPMQKHLSRSGINFLLPIFNLSWSLHCYPSSGRHLLFPNLPTSFFISRLARLGVKPRLCRSSWRAFASIHPLMLFSTSPREALLACPLSLPCNLPSFNGEFTLSSPCSHSDLSLSLSRQGAALAHLDSLPPHELDLWTDGSVPFPFGKGGFGVPTNYSLCDTEATLSISAGPVCSNFSTEACAILNALCWSRQHQQVCHFSSLLLLSDSRSVLSSIFPLI